MTEADIENLVQHLRTHTSINRLGHSEAHKVIATVFELLPALGWTPPAPKASR